MNYFSYFTEIEETFIRRRGKHLLLSPMDWALIESWKEMGVPLHVALRGIEHAFDSYASRPRKRSVKTLFYCQEEVEAQYAEWLESQLGAGGGAENGHDAEESEALTDASLPFPRTVILEHLSRARAKLEEVCAGRKQGRAEDAFCATLARAISRLQELEEDFARAMRPDAERLEASLTNLERMLDDALRARISKSGLDAARAAAEEQMQPYGARMETAIYEQTLNNLLLKRLREQAGMPRLSLFYL